MGPANTRSWVASAKAAVTIESNYPTQKPLIVKKPYRSKYEQEIPCAHSSENWLKLARFFIRSTAKRAGQISHEEAMQDKRMTHYRYVAQVQFVALSCVYHMKTDDEELLAELVNVVAHQIYQDAITLWAMRFFPLKVQAAGKPTSAWTRGARFVKSKNERKWDFRSAKKLIWFTCVDAKNLAARLEYEAKYM
jgi:hypothetical protein